MVNVQQSVLIHFVARDEISGTVGLMSGTLATFGIAATKMAADFDIAFARVASLLPQTKTQLKDLETDTLALSKALGVDAVKSMDALYEAISAGVPKEDALSFLAVASKAAIAGITDTETAVDGMTSAINAFEIPLSETQRVADQMFQAVNIGKFTFEELSASMGIASSIAHVTGVSLNEVLSAAATISKEGVTVSVAMTRIRSAITALNKPSETLKTIFQQLGVSTGKELVEKFGGLQGALEAIRDTADAMGIQLPKVFGRIEATLGTLALTGEKAASARDDLASVTETVNAMGQAFAKIDDTPVRDWQRAVVEFKDGMIEAANKSLPVMDGIINGLRSVTAELDKMPDGAKTAGVEFGTLFGTIGLGLAVGIKFYSILGSITQALFISTAAAKQAGVVWMQFGSIAATGLGAIVIWAAAAAVALVAVDAAMKKLTPSGKGILDRMFGPSGRTVALKKDLDEIMAKLAAIDELYPAGSQANTNRKDEFLTPKINALTEAIEKARELKKQYDLLSDTELAPGGQTVELKLPKEIQNAIHAAEDLGTELTKAYEEGNVSQSLFLKGMLQIHDALLMNGKEGLNAWEKIADTDAGKRYIALSAEIAKLDDDGILSRGKLAKANQELSNSYQGLDDDLEDVNAKLADNIDALQGSAREVQDAIDAMNKLGSAINSLNPEYQKNNALIALNELALAKLKNGARDAAGNLRPLNDEEQKQADIINGTIESLKNKADVMDKTNDAITALTAAVAASLSPFEKSGTIAEEDAQKFVKWASELENTQGVTDTTVQSLQLLGSTFQNFAKDPAQAIASLTALREKLGKDSPEWGKLANSFTKEFWKKLIGDLSDPSMAAGVAQILGGVLGLDLSDLGYAVANTYTGAIKRGLAGGDVDANPIDDIIANIKSKMGAAVPGFAEVGSQVGQAFLDGMSGGGGSGGKDKIKTAIDGFVSTFEDTMRASVLTSQFGELGGDLVDKLVVAIRDNTDQAGGALASSLVKIMDKFREIRPGPEAEAWGTALAGAVRNAIESGTPEAVQAVEDMLNQIKAVVDNHDIAISKINTIGSAITTALKNKYTAEKKAAIDAIDAKIAAAKTAQDTEERMANNSRDAALAGFDAQKSAAMDAFDAQAKAAEKSYDAQSRAAEDNHKAQIDAINESTKLRIDSINSQIDTLNRYIELEDRANNSIDHEDTMQSLQNDYARAKSNAERARIQKKIDKETRDYQQKLHSDSTKDAIAQLKDETDAIKDEADKRKDIIDAAYEAQKRARDDAYDALKESLDNQKKLMQESYDAQKKALDASIDAAEQARNDYYDNLLKSLNDEKDAAEKNYDGMLDDAAIQAEALKLLQAGNMEDLVKLLQTYYPNWQDAGRTLGEMLVDGVKTGLQDMAAVIAAALALASGAAGSLGIPTGSGSVSGGTGVGGGRSYTVQPGDTLTGIAAQLGVKWNDLYNNNIGVIGGDPSLIYPGQILKYAGGTPYARGGLSLVGDGGPELINLNAGAQVNSTGKTKSLIREAVAEALGQSSNDQSQIINVYIGQEKLDTIIVKSLSRSARNTY